MTMLWFSAQWKVTLHLGQKKNMLEYIIRVPVLQHLTAMLMWLTQENGFELDLINGSLVGLQLAVHQLMLQ